MNEEQSRNLQLNKKKEAMSMDNVIKIYPLQKEEEEKAFVKKSESILKGAMRALDTIDNGDLFRIKELTDPDPQIVLVLNAVLLLLGY